MKKNVIKWLIFGTLFTGGMGLTGVSVMMGGMDSSSSSADIQSTSKIKFTYNQEKVTAFLASYPYLADKLEDFLAAAKQNNVDPVLMIAIIVQETGGSSDALLRFNNPSGQMGADGLIKFATLAEGLDMTGRTLNNLVNERQLDTIEKLGSAYCPVGAANDPTGLNAHWVPNVTKNVELMGGFENQGESDDEFEFSGEGSEAGEALVEWGLALHKKGVIYTQSGSRGTFPYHDCSSFVTIGMKSIGFNVSIGSTESLYGMEGRQLMEISKEEIQAGDLFVWGNKGGSGGDYGHTGIF